MALHGALLASRGCARDRGGGDSRPQPESEPTPHALITAWNALERLRTVPPAAPPRRGAQPEQNTVRAAKG
eukprot:621682-Alexandrium_andersonii.AAC.1